MNQAQNEWLNGVVSEGYGKSDGARRLAGRTLFGNKKFPEFPDLERVLPVVKAAMKPDQVELMMVKGDWQFGVEPNLETDLQLSFWRNDDVNLPLDVLKVRFELNNVFQDVRPVYLGAPVRRRFKFDKGVPFHIHLPFQAPGQTVPLFEGIFYRNALGGEDFDDDSIEISRRLWSFREFCEKFGAQGLDLPGYSLILDRVHPSKAVFVDRLGAIMDEGHWRPIIGIDGVRGDTHIVRGPSDVNARSDIDFCPTFRVKLT